MDRYKILTTLENETEGYTFSDFSEPVEDWLLRDDGTPDFGHIYRLMQQEYGRCESSVYVDREGGPVRIGWCFRSRQQYEDTREPYIRTAWVTIVREVEPAHGPVYEPVPVGSSRL